MYFRSILLSVATSAALWCDAPLLCDAPSEIRAELKKSFERTITDSTAFDQNVAPFLALRERYSDNLTVHEQYQDAVNRHGIEGHLKHLTEEYAGLELEHAGNLKYHYLAIRSLAGRATPAAIHGLADILAENPDFAPAHRMLAEIYGAEAFRDPEKEKLEREKYLVLCPGSVLTRRPVPLPEPSPLLDQAQRQLAENVDPDRIIATTVQALRDDEWRNQRIRPFDWYSVDYKRESLRRLRSKYWRAWSIQVSGYRKAGRPGKVDELLAQMDRRAMRSQGDPGYWDMLETLARFYVESRQPEQANLKLNQMEQFLATNPDPIRAARLEALRK